MKDQTGIIEEEIVPVTSTTDGSVSFVNKYKLQIVVLLIMLLGIALYYYFFMYKGQSISLETPSLSAQLPGSI